jgi:hypothetical protein
MNKYNDIYEIPEAELKDRPANTSYSPKTGCC